MNHNFVQQQANLLNNCVEAGMKAERAVQTLRMSGLRAAYERAQADPETRIPSYLMAVIEELLR